MWKVLLHTPMRLVEFSRLILILLYVSRSYTYTGSTFGPEESKKESSHGKEKKKYLSTKTCLGCIPCISQGGQLIFHMSLSKLSQVQTKSLIA